MTLSIEQYVDTKEFENDDVEEKDEKNILQYRNKNQFKNYNGIR